MSPEYFHLMVSDLRYMHAFRRRVVRQKVVKDVKQGSCNEILPRPADYFRVRPPWQRATSILITRHGTSVDVSLRLREDNAPIRQGTGIDWNISDIRTFERRTRKFRASVFSPNRWKNEEMGKTSREQKRKEQRQVREKEILTRIEKRDYMVAVRYKERGRKIEGEERGESGSYKGA